MLIFLVIVFVFCAVMVFVGDFETEMREDSLYIDAVMWSDLEIVYDDIEHIEFRETDAVGSRIFGYGDVRVYMGTFENEEFGTYTRYSHRETASCILLRAFGKTIVLNGEDKAQTVSLYESLLSKVE